jgi:hypothetical protein
MVTQLKTGTLRPSKAPNLLIAPVDYQQSFQDQYSNALRLYFAQIDNFNQALGSDTGGSFLSFPYISASDSATQYATGNNTPTIVQWNTLEAGLSFTLNANFTATAQKSGVYKITYSAQLANNSNSPVDVLFWLRVNNIDAPRSTTDFTVPARKSAGVPSFVCGYSEVVFYLNANDTVGLWWGTPTAATSGGGLGTYIFAQAAQTSPMAYPAIPSVIGSITFLSST